MPRPRVLRSRRAVAAIAAGLLCLGLAACGSQLDPNTIAAANGTNGTGGGTVAPGVAQTDSAGNPLPGTNPSGASSDGTGSGGNNSAPVTDPGTGQTVAPDPGNPTAPSVPDQSAGPGGNSSSGTNPTGSGSSAAPSGSNSSAAPANGGNTAPDCSKLKNTTGITDTTIDIGNSSDITGPVPGLFKSAQDAVKAYVAYFNSTNPDGICGRSLTLDSYDSQTNASADQQNYVQACSKDFAMVGSMSGFDEGGAAAAQSCGIPDLRSAAVTQERNDCTVCFGTQSAATNEFENAVPEFLKSQFGGGQHAAMFYLNAGAAAENGKTQVAADTKAGIHFDVVQGINVSDFDYTSYVQELKDKDIETVQFVGANQYFVRMAQAMQQNGYTPKVFLLDPTAYSTQYTTAAGSAALAENTYVYTNFVPFFESNTSPEEQTYLAYLNQVDPGAEPNFFGVFAWSAARLFVQEALKLGGNLTRASMVQALKGVSNWTDNGLHGPQQVGAKNVGSCWRLLKWSGSAWVSSGSAKYSCDGITTL